MTIIKKIQHIILLLPRALARYVIWHIAFLDNAYRTNIWRLNGHLFCLLFNFRAFVRRKSIRFKYDSENSIYRAESDGRQRFFHSKFTSLIAYSNGLKVRSQEIGAVYFLPAIVFQNGDRVIDCGANIGDLKLYFDFKDIDIEYLGIEPSPDEFECLVKNVVPGNSANFGLWHEDGELIFYVSSHNGDSSFIKPEKFTHERRIQTKRLDALISGRVKLLKIEAEGAEPEVLQGCEKLLPDIEYISADLGFERGVRAESTLPFAANFLINHGFELVGIGYPRLIGLFRNKAFKSDN